MQLGARKGWTWPGLLAWLLSATVAMPALAKSSSDLNSFLAAYQCPLYKALETIRAQEMTPLNRFLVLSFDKDRKPDHYVQCIFENQDTQLYCEASSGLYGKGPVKLSRRAPESLTTLGFDMSTTGPVKNFWQYRPIRGSADVWDAARLMLETFYLGYGARLKNRIAIKAPFVHGSSLRRGDSSCLTS